VQYRIPTSDNAGADSATHALLPGGVRGRYPRMHALPTAWFDSLTASTIALAACASADTTVAPTAKAPVTVAPTACTTSSTVSASTAAAAPKNSLHG